MFRWLKSRLIASNENAAAADVAQCAAEVTSAWLIHRGLMPDEYLKDIPLADQIERYAAIAFPAMLKRYPSFKNTSAKTLWQIYFTGIAKAKAHDEQQLLDAFAELRRRYT